MYKSAASGCEDDALEFAAVDLMFLDETPFIGNYVYPRPSTAYFNPYLASQVGFLACEEDIIQGFLIALPSQTEVVAPLCCCLQCVPAIPLL